MSRPREKSRRSPRSGSRSTLAAISALARSSGVEMRVTLDAITGRRLLVALDGSGSIAIKHQEHLYVRPMMALGLHVMQRRMDGLIVSASNRIRSIAAFGPHDCSGFFSEPPRGEGGGDNFPALIKYAQDCGCDEIVFLTDGSFTLADYELRIVPFVFILISTEMVEDFEGDERRYI